MARSSSTSYYRYIISSFDIIIPKKDPISILSGNINSIGIEKDFDNDFFPILFVNINLSPTVYYTIMQNKTTVKFRIRMDKYIYDRTSSVRYKECVFNTSFSMFTDDNSPFMDEDLYKKSKEINGTGTQMSDFKRSYDFYLFKDKDVSAAKKVVNTVIKSTNMTNIIAYLLSTAGFSNVLMTPLDNNTTYNEVILLPVSVLNNIKYLDQQYGFYRYGRMTFFDFNTAYFIDKRATCTAYRNNEYTDVVVICNKSTNPNSLTPGNYKDNKNKCYMLNIQKDNVKMVTSSIISDQLEGNKILSVSPSTDGVDNINADVQQRGSGSNYVVINKFNNPYTNSSIKYRKLENDSVLDVTMADVDIDCLAPNKRFKISFEDSSIQKTRGGDYRISYAAFDFKKEGNEFSITGAAQFKKIK